MGPRVQIKTNHHFGGETFQSIFSMKSLSSTVITSSYLKPWDITMSVFQGLKQQLVITVEETYSKYF